MNRLQRTLITIIFAALLVGPAAYLRWSQESGERASAASESSPDVLQRYGFRLKEQARDAGVDFTHQPLRLDQRLDHIAPQIAAMGASVSVVDFDQDGWQDFYVTNSASGSMNGLYRNLGNGQFVDVAREVGLADLNKPGTGACMGSVWADIDNDDDEDVLVYKWGRPELYRNDRGERFERITDSSGLPDWANLGCATWLDYDRDGLIDLFLAGYWSEDVRLEQLKTTRIMPESFEYANNGGRKWLLRNNGDGTFEDATAESGIDSTRWTLAVISADFNGDRFPDLFLSNDYGVSELFINRQGDRFEEIGKESGIGHAPKSGMNAAIGDVLNQGRLAIYESNISEEGVLLQGNNLWFPSASGATTYENLASVMGVELAGWSFGAQFGDLDNNGFVDLYVTNGYVSGDRGTSYWYDFSQITGGHRNIISDTDNWPDMKGRSLAGYQPKRVWLNDGAGQFQDVAQLIGATDRHDGRGVALVDLDNRGALDVLVANQRGPLLMYRNQVDPQRNWIAFELKGTRSNRSAIGTQVQVHWKNQQQLQELVAASGYSAQNQRRLHFGLGTSDQVDKVSILWPSGQTQELSHPAINQTHRIEEPK
ncbi:CRTAC1 family protein [Roseiconus nitratireducens]|uniref:CRTAC1 family protein n=1 Tax=Roseiconus nitratireducens TaxID=2605748 RepID=A0A5M6D704_9BACT|nr:CRTAC1 family protein [Roseiconus nitratireducens]KAA5543153.1 CRTAC1 family protein [Roseiconus nitratireducens]